jgi:uncharacterized protein YkwD
VGASTIAGTVPRHLVHRLAAVQAAALAALALASPAFASRCPGADVVPGPAGLTEARRATFCLLNHERRVYGLRLLRPNTDLRDAAQAYSVAMVDEHFFGHVSPEGSTLLSRVRDTAYPFRSHGWMLGENIAWGAGRRGRPRAVVRAWMRSPGHRRNILTARFTRVGIGITPGAPVAGSAGMAAATYTTDFGTG